MVEQERPFDWRVPAVWAVLLVLSVFAHAHVEVTDEAQRGRAIGFGRALIIESASHLVIAALLPVLYWLHRNWPIGQGLRNLAIHALGLVPFSLAHTLGMAALRYLWFAGVAGESYAFPITVDRLTYEFAKDIVNYAMLTGGVAALPYLLRRLPSPAAVAAPPPSLPAESLPERFTVRKRGGSEVVVEVADIDWIEAAGNYAILHVGGDTFEIRSSLAKLEVELDPKRFVRVHKSHVVNISRVAEVTPWVSGDWRIRMQDGAEVNLSRRYRRHFEALAPVRS
jgi:hypothetical protein